MKMKNRHYLKLSQSLEQDAEVIGQESVVIREEGKCDFFTLFPIQNPKFKIQNYYSSPFAFLRDLCDLAVNTSSK